MNKFLSEKVLIYPCATRNTNIDPQASSLNEFGLTSRLYGSGKSRIISFPEDGPVEFIIKGYYFKLLYSKSELADLGGNCFIIATSKDDGPSHLVSVDGAVGIDTVVNQGQPGEYGVCNVLAVGSAGELDDLSKQYVDKEYYTLPLSSPEAVDIVAVDTAEFVISEDTSTLSINAINKDKVTGLMTELESKLDATDAITIVQVNGDGLGVDSNTVNILVAEGTEDGTIAVNNCNVSVHGLGSAAFTNADAYADKEATAIAIADALDAAKAYADAKDVETSYNDSDLRARVEAIEDDKLTDRVSALEANKETWDKAGTALQEDDLEPYATTEYVVIELDRKVDKDAYEDTVEALSNLENKVNNFLGTEASEALDSLNELIDYIDYIDSLKDTDIADIIEDIQAIENKLIGIDGAVADYVGAAIEALKIGEYAKAADLTALAGRVKTLEDTYAIKTDVESAISTAKSEAIADADGKLATKVNTSDFEAFKEESIIAIDTAKSEAISAAAAAEEAKGYAVATTVASTYATKNELGEAVNEINKALALKASSETVNGLNETVSTHAATIDRIDRDTKAIENKLLGIEGAVADHISEAIEDATAAIADLRSEFGSHDHDAKYATSDTTYEVSKTDNAFEFTVTPRTGVGEAQTVTLNAPLASTTKDGLLSKEWYAHLIATDDTIKGAMRDLASDLTGTEEDTEEDLTILGIKNYAKNLCDNVSTYTSLDGAVTVHGALDAILIRLQHLQEAIEAHCKLEYKIENEKEIKATCTGCDSTGKILLDSELEIYYGDAFGSEDLQTTDTWQFRTQLKNYVLSKLSATAILRKIFNSKHKDELTIEVFVGDVFERSLGSSIDGSSTKLPGAMLIKISHDDWKDEAGTVQCFNIKLLNTVHIISFNSNGGSEVQDIVAPLGSVVEAPTDPTRAEYTFGGWFTEAECENVYSFPTTMPAADITLYADWKETPTVEPDENENPESGTDPVASEGGEDEEGEAGTTDSGSTGTSGGTEE